MITRSNATAAEEIQVHIINYKLPLTERVSGTAFFHAKCAEAFKNEGNVQLQRAHERCVIEAAEYLEEVLRHAQ